MSNRFLHMYEGPHELIVKHASQRRMGQLAGTCFQRCTGLDISSVLDSITYDVDQVHGTAYHSRFMEFLKLAQKHNVLIDAGMTDPKRDRSNAPHAQADPDLFQRVYGRKEEGAFIRCAWENSTDGWNQAVRRRACEERGWNVVVDEG